MLLRKRYGSERRGKTAALRDEVEVRPVSGTPNPMSFSSAYAKGEELQCGSYPAAWKRAERGVRGVSSSRNRWVKVDWSPRFRMNSPPNSVISPEFSVLGGRGSSGASDRLITFRTINLSLFFLGMLPSFDKDSRIRPKLRKMVFVGSV